MTSIYEGLICELKIKLKHKNIKFNKIFSLINNKKYNTIIKIIHDKTIQTVIKNIVDEREKIGNNMEKKLNDLLWLNDRLIQFGKEPQSSKTKAIKLLKTKVFINIYALEAENYERITTKKLLRKQLIENPEIRFPLYSAKENTTLKCFLIKLKLKKTKKTKNKNMLNIVN